jgi:soluble lytic murein transglycosylase-like protein
VCAVLAEGRAGHFVTGHFFRELRIQANLPSANELRSAPGPRRPFLIALAAAGLLAALEFTPSRALETPPLSAVIAASAPAEGLPRMRPAGLPETPVDSALLEREVVSRYDYRPLARLLGRHNRDPEMVRRIARALVKEAGRLEVAPSLLTGLLLTENPRLERGTVSSQGAIGLMQVMHFHAGEFDCESDDLLDVESNICHGAGVFGSYLKRTGNVRRALLRYNGCVASTNTPNCHRYPAKVIRVAGQVRRDLLAYPGR